MYGKNGVNVTKKGEARANKDAHNSKLQSE
jgi:hypothetical protein